MQSFRLATKWSVFLIAFFFALLPACKKDFIDTPQIHVSPGSKATNRNSINKKEARDWFRNQFGYKKQVQIENGSGTVEFAIKPVWALSSEGVYGDTLPIPIVITPVQEIANCNFGKRGAYFLLFYKDDQANMQSRLVICVGDSTYSDGTKPKTFSDFSGFLIKMDLNGVFQQRVSFIQNGHSIFDIFPNPHPDSTGTIVWCFEDFFEGGFGGAGGEGGAGASRNPWFDPAYMYWIFGDHHGTLVITAPPSSHIFTFNPPFGVINASHGNSGGGNNNGSGNTSNNPSTGNVLELYHFSTVYNNPMFQISEYFENMGLSGQAYQIFGFLDSAGRQFLANEQNFIDPFYDFLDAQNHSSHARTAVSEMIAFMMQNLSILLDARGFLAAHAGDQFANQSLTTMLLLAEQGHLTGPYPSNERDAIIAQYNFPDPSMYSEYIFNCVFLKQQHSDWSDFHIAAEAYWMTITGFVHTGLDICGLIPAGGEPCDFINGVLYIVEGDGVNAGLSFAATITIAGWAATGAKYADVAVGVLGTQATIPHAARFCA